jgi:uncharacterized membrane protein
LGVEDAAMVAVRTMGTLIVIFGFLIYVYAANVYVAKHTSAKENPPGQQSQYRKSSRS